MMLKYIFTDDSAFLDFMRMPTKKITPDLRKKIISDLLRGKTQVFLAAKYDISERTIRNDKSKNASLWKSEAVALICRELTSSAEQLAFVERHLKQRAETDEEYLGFLDDARFELIVLGNQLKRVKKVFCTDT